MGATKALFANGPLFELAAAILAIVFGVLSSVRTWAFRRRTGRNPWGIHPNLWAAIGFCLGIVGWALAHLACVTTPESSLLGATARSASGLGPVPAVLSDPGTPPPGWYPDPAGQHHYRFFTGADWTDNVVDDGVQSRDALPHAPGT